MPTFEIPDGPTTVVDVTRPPAGSKDPAKGAVVFNVTNKSSEGCDGRLSVQASGASKPEWFTIDGDRERPFAAGETHSANVKIAIPNDIAGGEYPFQLRIVAVNDPDNDHAEGPVTTAKLPAQQAVVKKGIPWWVWLIIGLVVLIALGVGGYFLLGGKGDDDDGEPTNNVVVAEAKVPKFVDQKVDAIAADAGGYQIIKNETPNTGRQPRIVYAQEPAADTPLKAGQRVIVSYEPGVAVPDLPDSANFSNAPNILRNAGLQPGNFLCDSSSGTAGAPVGKVTAFVPTPRTIVASNSKVDMRAIQAARCVGRFTRPDLINRTVIDRSVMIKMRQMESIR